MSGWLSFDLAGNSVSSETLAADLAEGNTTRDSSTVVGCLASVIYLANVVQLGSCYPQSLGVAVSIAEPRGLMAGVALLLVEICYRGICRLDINGVSTFHIGNRLTSSTLQYLRIFSTPSCSTSSLRCAQSTSPKPSRMPFLQSRRSARLFGAGR